MRILLIEDNADHRELMCRALTEYDLTWQVDAVVSGKEALRHLAEWEAYDLVFLDYSLPERDGLEVLKEIRRGEAPPPVVMVTGRGDEQVAVAAMKGGAYDYVVKGEDYLQRLPVVAQRAVEAHQLAIEIKRAEEALRISARQWQTTFDAIGDAVCLLDLDGKIMQCNTAMSILLGEPCGEIIGRTCWELVHGTLEPIEGCPIVRLRQTRRRETRILPLDGRWFNITTDPLLDEAGNLLGAVHIMTDITERKKLEEAKRETEELFSQFMRNFPGSAYIKDSDRRIIQLTENVEKYFGIKAVEWLGKTSEEIWPPELAAQVRKDDEAALQGKAVRSITERPQKGELRTWMTQRFPIPRKDKPPLIGCISIDITDRVRAEEALRESEERYRAVARLSSDFAYSCAYTGDDGYEVDWITDAFFTLTGYSKAELHEQRCWLFVSHPDDREMATKPLRELKAGESGTSEFRIVTKEGRVLYIVNYMECQADPEARGGLRLFGAVQDITERKRAEEALRYQAVLLANTHDAIIASDEHYRLTAWNAAAESLYGWKAEEVLGRFGLDVTQTEFSGVEKSEMLRSIAETGHWRGEVTQARKDGTRIPVEVATIVLHDESGRITGYVSVNRDITERKRAELEYKTIVGTAMDGFWIIDAQGRFLDTNDAYCRLIGYSREELLKMKISDIEAKEKPKETVRHIRKIMEVGGDRFETRHRCKDGRVVDIEVSTNYDKESGDKLFVFLRDVTQRKQMGETLVNYIGELQQLSKQLIAVQEAERLRISQELHDEMGQALTMLRINIASIKVSLPPSCTKGIKDRLADADALTEKILGQIHELTLELRPHMLDDLGLVPTLRWYTERLSRRLNIQILFTQKNWKRRLTPEIRTALFRIIQEALTNVAKHARAKKVRILLAQKQKFIEVLVEDDGRGFDQRKIEKRLSRARGIGLFSMKERAALLNGECTIESHPGAGTKVRIRIPWRKAVEKN